MFLVYWFCQVDSYEMLVLQRRCLFDFMFESISVILFIGLGNYFGCIKEKKIFILLVN